MTKRNVLKHTTLFVALVTVTTVAVSLETGHLVAGLKVGLVVGPIKFAVAAIHARIFA